uniref:MATH domain-containing protein n=1 Tax=Strigamia maritima TaxID=126957 RepID=T1IS07_STRMM
MDSEILICFKCGLKSLFLKDQLCGIIFCQRCGAKTHISNLTSDNIDTRLRLLEKAVENSNSEKELCGYCNSAVDAETIQSHYDICEMYPINCNFCNRKFIRRTIKIHALECGCNLQKCKFSRIGCQFEGNQFEMERHENDNVHLEFVMNLLLNLQTEANRNNSGNKKSSTDEYHMKKLILNQKIEIYSCKQQIVNLELKFKELQHNYEKQQVDVENYQKTLTTVINANNQLTKAVAEDKKMLSDKIDALSLHQNQFEDNMEKNNNQQTEVRKKLRKLENNCNKLNQTRKKIDDIETDLRDKLSSIHTSGHFIWKVENFTQLQLNAKSGTEEEVYSEPFYTSEFGYKMRLRLEPNGNGEGKGTHLSIFLQVMKGPNDAILKWPIEYSADFSLIDQLNHKNDYSYKIESDLIKLREYYVKPVTEFNIPLGICKFISFGKLKPLHLVDDTIFIKLDLKIISH